jgi:hypothetical protein
VSCRKLTSLQRFHSRTALGPLAGAGVAEGLHPKRQVPQVVSKDCPGQTGAEDGYLEGQMVQEESAERWLHQSNPGALIPQCSGKQSVLEGKHNLSASEDFCAALFKFIILLTFNPRYV